VEVVAARELAMRAVLAGMDVVAGRAAGPGVEDAAEAAIRQVLVSGSRLPVLGDQENGDPGHETTWIVDPVDGTVNLMRGDPFVAVTVALLVDGQPLAGATGCPFTGEIWAAARGRGARDARGRPLPPAAPEGSRGPVVLDPQSSDARHLAVWRAVRTRLESAFGAVDLRGSIALALAHVASSRIAGFVHVGGSPAQDFAAGVLLVSEVGGLVTALDGGEPWNAPVAIAGMPTTYERLRKILADVL
jgi:myo-inositol-1(or 4)-monophosphatase